jgi:hypothetical protein
MYPRSWKSQAVAGLGVVLAVAIVGRAAWELLAPLVPVVITLLLLCSIFWFIFRR